MSTTRLPDFILVGAPRCATTWLHECLLEHPDVFLPDCKELNFFCVNHWGKDYEEHGISYYQSFFSQASDSQVIGDISPNNMWDLRSSDRLLSVVPNAKILFLLRNPVDRAWSHYQYITNRTGTAPHSFEEVIAGAWRTSGVIEQGFYAEQMRPYFERFPRERLLVVLNDQIRSQPEDSFDRICNFVGAAPGVRPTHLRNRRNRAHGQRIAGLYQLNRAVARGLSQVGLDSIRRAIKRTGAPRLLKRLNRRAVPRASLAPSHREALAKHYAEDVAALARLLDRDLSDWMKT